MPVLTAAVTIETLLFILEMSAKYGLPAVVDIVKTWIEDKGKIGPDDFKALEAKMKPAASYFEDQPKG